MQTIDIIIAVLLVIGLVSGLRDGAVKQVAGLAGLIGGLLIGLIEKFGTLFWTESYAQLVVFAVFVFMLMFRPKGLLGKES